MLRLVTVLVVSGFLFAGFGASGAAGDDPDEVFKRELKAISGTWRPVSVETDGMKVSEDRLKETVQTRGEDGKVVIRVGDKVVLEGTVKKVDATKSPKTIDTEVTLGENKGKTVQGIYEVDGDTLRICVALPGKAERPTEFTAKAGSNWSLAVYKRAKK